MVRKKVQKIFLTISSYLLWFSWKTNFNWILLQYSKSYFHGKIFRSYELLYFLHNNLGFDTPYSSGARLICHLKTIIKCFFWPVSSAASSEKKSSHLNGNLRKMNGSVGGSHFIFNGWASQFWWQYDKRPRVKEANKNSNYF